jgi:hypothetical protein
MTTTINADNGVSSGSAGLKSSADNSGLLQLQTNGTAALTVDTSQNVGIGTASPGYPLQVKTGSSNMNTVTMINDATQNLSALGFVQAGSTTLAYTSIYGDGRSTGYMSFKTNDTERLRIDTSGNVGIGTSSPSGKLHIYGTGSTLRPIIQGTTNQVDWSINNTSGQLYVGIDGSAGGTTGTPYGAYIYNATATPLTFHTNAVEQARIDSAGLFKFNSGYGSAATAYGCRAWVRFDGTTAPGTIAASGNVSSVTRNATGDYTINFTNAMPDANYSTVCAGGLVSGYTPNCIGPNQSAPTTGSVRITTFSVSASAAFANFTNNCVAIFR